MKIWYRRNSELKKILKKNKRKREMFEIDEEVRISSFLRINSEKMLENTLNSIIAKKSMKNNWKIKGKIIIKRNIRKCRSLQTKERLQN